MISDKENNVCPQQEKKTTEESASPHKLNMSIEAIVLSEKFSSQFWIWITNSIGFELHFE